jgi:hypothetical protein
MRSLQLSAEDTVMMMMIIGIGVVAGGGMMAGGMVAGGMGMTMTSY